MALSTFTRSRDPTGWALRGRALTPTPLQSPILPGNHYSGGMARKKVVDVRAPKQRPKRKYLAIAAVLVVAIAAGVILMILANLNLSPFPRVPALPSNPLACLSTTPLQISPAAGGGLNTSFQVIMNSDCKQNITASGCKQFIMSVKYWYRDGSNASLPGDVRLDMNSFSLGSGYSLYATVSAHLPSPDQPSQVTIYTRCSA